MYGSLFYVCLCFLVLCDATYVVPPSLVEPLTPRGLRVSIPDEEGITLMAFHGNVNVPIENLDGGTMSKDIITKRGNRWVFEDKNVRLKKGDVIYYWVYVILDGLGYQGLGRNHTVTEFFPADGSGTTPSSCKSSITRVHGASTCSKKLLFEATFNGDKPNPNVWFIEKKLGGSNLDDEFVMFSDQNCYVAGNCLEIKPSLLEERFSVDFIKNGGLIIKNCTSNKEEFCKKTAVSYSILPPIQSSRISTKNSFSFQYGVVEVKAKLPQGNWIVPELWLEPKEIENTGRIVIGLTRGNIELFGDGNDISSKTLNAGVVFNSDHSQMLRKQEQHQRPWTENFHIFKVEWTKSNLVFSVDGEQIGIIDNPDPSRDFIPFNQEFYITLGIHVGGLRDFPDSATKPWDNNHVKRVLTFWNDRLNWIQTWNRNSTLFVEHVKVWAI